MAENKNNKNKPDQDINQLLKVRREKYQALVDAGKDPFVITKYDVSHHSNEIRDQFDELEFTPPTDEEGKALVVPIEDIPEGKLVSLAGRMMFKRVMGKASFANVRDRNGDMQIYVTRNDIGDEEYAAFKKLDVGDILGIKGFAFKTRTGEISVHAKEVTLLSKSLQILPEKFHGLVDTDLKYRQRYVDLIMNTDVRDTFIKRSKILHEIRTFLEGRDFMEVETPILVSNAGGAAARPFETHFNALDEDFKLRISLELNLKRLIVGGLERVFEIGRVFRNEGVDTRHNPEFTLMELYQAYTDYYGMMELTESMYRHVVQAVCGTTVITYNGIEIDFGKPFERITMTECVKKYSGIDFDLISTDEEAFALAREHDFEIAPHYKKGNVLNVKKEEDEALDGALGG